MTTWQTRMVLILVTLTLKGMRKLTADALKFNLSAPAHAQSQIKLVGCQETNSTINLSCPLTVVEELIPFNGKRSYRGFLPSTCPLMAVARTNGVGSEWVTVRPVQ